MKLCSMKVLKQVLDHLKTICIRKKTILKSLQRANVIYEPKSRLVFCKRF